jgi:hypothetical protein
MTVLLVAIALAGVREPRGNDRPTLPDGAQTVLSEDGRYRLHWSDSPDFAPQGPVEDGVPFGVTVVLDALVDAEVAYARRGYHPTTGDDGTGGDAALDVYFLPIDANGYAYPLTDASPNGGSACYIELDSGLRGTLLSSVAQHELHHCVQFRYSTQSAGWIYEASATWEQYLLADESLDIGLQLLYAARLSEPNRPIDDRGDRYEYAGFLVFKHLDEFRRAAPRSVQVWEALARDPDWESALARVADDAFDLTLAEWFAAYSTWNAFACGLSDEDHYDQTVAGCTSPQTIPIQGVITGEPTAIVLPDAPYTSHTLEWTPDTTGNAVQVTCDAPESGALVLTVVPVDADGIGQVPARTAERTRTITLRSTDALPNAGSARIIVASTGDEPLSVECTVRAVAPALAEPSSCSTMTTPVGWSALWLSAIAALGRRGKRRRR